ncbi:MAG: hypothetical protein U1A72_09080 [Sulfuritalea sp.]|nr:hypothetical protein [Sulfuritalea sp.]
MLLQVRVTPQAVRDKPGVSTSNGSGRTVGNKAGRNTGNERNCATQTNKHKLKIADMVHVVPDECQYLASQDSVLMKKHGHFLGGFFLVTLPRP